MGGAYRARFIYIYFRFPHVAGIGGVADTGVLVFDPLPLNNGEKSWKTRSWLDEFLAHSATGR
ncbi:MAG: hypothetical protein LH614_18765 [Pyrinomonadaceae bacterium]|nr:hypothetical protein [Pyrinomonadaceae bacterium]